MSTVMKELLDLQLWTFPLCKLLRFPSEILQKLNDLNTKGLISGREETICSSVAPLHQGHADSPHALFQVGSENSALSVNTPPCIKAREGALTPSPDRVTSHEGHGPADLLFWLIDIDFFSFCLTRQGS